MPSLGFENLSLRGLEAQQREAARALRDEGSGKAGKDTGTGLTPDQQRQVEALQATDRRVRAHEEAHIAVGRDLVRGTSFSYETGPDKKRYVVAGEVNIDTSEAETPEKTIPKAAHIRDAALAPADPSPQDRQVAAFATQMELTARQEVAQQAVEARQRAGSGRGSRAVGAYQQAGGLQLSAGFSAVA